MEQQNYNNTIITKWLITLLNDLQESLLQSFKERPESFTKNIEIYWEKTSSISSHCRHIIEVIQAIITNTDWIIDYTKRKRDETITADISIFDKSMDILKQQLQKTQNQSITGKQILIGEKLLEINTTYSNELSYLLEHTIHHMAIIKSNCMMIWIHLHSNFGKAYSTRYHEKSNLS